MSSLVIIENSVCLSVATKKGNTHLQNTSLSATLHCCACELTTSLVSLLMSYPFQLQMQANQHHFQLKLCIPQFGELSVFFPIDCCTALFKEWMLQNWVLQNSKFVFGTRFEVLNRFYFSAKFAFFRCGTFKLCCFKLWSQPALNFQTLHPGL